MAEEAPSALDRIQHHGKRAFLAAYAQHGIVRRAAEEVEIDRTTVYFWRKTDPDFVTAMEVADALAIEALEDTARTMAIENLHPTMVIFLLKAAKPEVYNRAPVQDKQDDAKRESFNGVTIVAEPEPSDD